MSALYDIIVERLLVDLSREVIHGRKVFQLKHKPDRVALLKAGGIDEETYFFWVICYTCEERE